MVQQMAELSELFKEINAVVVQQGTILDRIDFNIAAAHQQVGQSKTHIQSAYKLERSSRATGCTVCLLVSNAICVVILGLKWL